MAQSVSRPEDGPAPEPLDQWEAVSRAAAADTGAARDPLASLDSLQIVYCQTWQYDDPIGRLADRLGAAPGHRVYSGIGGTTPQVLVDDLARLMLAGAVDVALVCGAEALDTVRRLRKAGEKPPFSHRDPERKPFPFEAPFHPAEVAHEVYQAWLTFPLWDIARRARLGLDPADHRRLAGELFAPMTRVAAANPYAWFPLERSAEELATPTAENRIVGFPYTKYLVSVMDVDMAAALVLATHQAADDLGVPPERRVYLRGWCYAADPTYVAEHEPLWASPAMGAAARAALAAAGIGVDDVAHFDLYSCFPSSVWLALDALGLDAGDRRGVTVTGGLPYAGGAASDYMTHAIATMVERLRHDPGAKGLVTGVGMHLTKHVAAVYSSAPPEDALVPPDEAGIQAALREDHPPVPIRDTYAGTARVATFTVAHGRDGSPEWGLAVCDLPGGDRCYAKVLDPDVLAEMEATEWVGTIVHLTPTPDHVNLATPTAPIP